jgi:hypothetical protein
MKEYGCCPKFKRGDNSTYTFTKRGSHAPYTVVVHYLHMCMTEYGCLFLHAHLQVVYYNCVKFHKNPIGCLGGVALTRCPPSFRESTS